MTTPLKSARSVADVTTGSILAVVEIAVPPERVFRALTDSQEVVLWWGSRETYQVTQWEGDLRPGGQWRSTGVSADGQPFSVSGEFLEVDPPRRLVQTWKADWDEGATTTVRYQLEAIPGGTRVTLLHDGFGERAASCERHANGWERVLGWLGAHFAAPRAPAAGAGNYYFCRLLPPRPSFAQDMSPAEAEVMKRHAAYLSDLLAKGNAVIFGPVGDPQGSWGLAILRASGEEELRALLAGDPFIQEGLGFHYETLPMLRAVH
jgi:uncharacterized protein YndB with AHSA1/START domain/uncharacterized protein YciI